MTPYWSGEYSIFHHARMQSQNTRLRSILILVISLAVLLAVVMGLALWFLFHRYVEPLASSLHGGAKARSEARDYAQSNSVSLLLGEGDESGEGLTHPDQERDGLTAIETLNGVPTRTLQLTDNRNTLMFYFRIDPTFKQGDVRRVRIDVEYLDPQPGTLGLHYDALDSPNVAKPVYRESLRPIRLGGSNVWQTATFYTKGDAAFSNRQNGQSDFRIWAKAPILHLRRVTVTRAPAPEDQLNLDFSTNRQLTLLLGQETSGDGLRHLGEEGDGRTTIENVNGVPCRYLNRAGQGKQFGYLYFTIHPSFKRDGLKEAVIEFEYLARRSGALRLQYDGMEGEVHRAYKSAVSPVGTTVRFGPQIMFNRMPGSNGWQTMSFRVTDGAFMNSQNGDADFRLEVVPPEIYVRRVTVRRGLPQLPPPPVPERP